MGTSARRTHLVHRAGRRRAFDRPGALAERRRRRLGRAGRGRRARRGRRVPLGFNRQGGVVVREPLLQLVLDRHRARGRRSTIRIDRRIGFRIARVENRDRATTEDAATRSIRRPRSRARGNDAGRRDGTDARDSSREERG
eukprot:31463-Pelagococcus_subviridis.AAC.11